MRPPINTHLSQRSALWSTSCLLLLATVATGLATAGSAGAVQHSNTHASPRAGAARCRALHLTGLVIGVALERAGHAGCRLRLAGSPVQQPTIQTIRRQSSHTGRRGPIVTVWVNPLCSGSADWGAPRGEPLHAPGPTELISGLYLDGGPHRFRSAPRCASLSGDPLAGTIAVTDATSGAIVATETVVEGQLARIQLPAGTYTITGTFANASSNNHMQSLPQTVTILSGQTVRQDASAPIS
jgi:hypothetical protein